MKQTLDVAFNRYHLCNEDATLVLIFDRMPYVYIGAESGPEDFLPAFQTQQKVVPTSHTKS